jgi:4'-phosphopantetheinyl transferase
MNVSAARACGSMGRMSVPADLTYPAIHVFRAALDISCAEQDVLMESLSAPERERASHFHFENDRRKFIVRSGVRRQLLAKYLNTSAAQIAFKVTTFGKPSLDAPYDQSGLHFNSSDSGERAVYALTLQRDLGIDIEVLRPLPDADKLAQRYFSPAELRILLAFSGVAREHYFFRIWSRKEAILKTVGVGLSGNLQRVDVSTPAELCEQWMPLQYDAGMPVMWRDIELESGYSAAVAVAGEAGDVLVRDWSGK